MTAFDPNTINRRTAALNAALPRHACVACGEFGPFRLVGAWWCRVHCEPDSRGSWGPTAEGLALAAERDRRSA